MDDTASAALSRGGDTGGRSLCHPQPLGGEVAPAKASVVECGEGKVTKAESVWNLLDREDAPGPRARRTEPWERNSPKLGAG